MDAAALTLRERGVAATGVDGVMRRAGLTHGGFYAHFRNKSELVAEACAAAFESAGPNLERITAGPTPAVRARLLIDSYLGVRHRDNPGSGCVIVTVGADMVRLRGQAREGCARGLSQHLRRLAAALRLEPEPADNLRKVTLLMSALVGALLFARAIEDAEESDALLHAIRRQLRDQYCRETPARPPSRPPARPEPTHDFMRAF